VTLVRTQMFLLTLNTELPLAAIFYFFSVFARLAFVERVFSQDSVIMHPRHSKTSDSVLENLMFLRSMVICNYRS